MGKLKMEKDRIINLIEDVLNKDDRLVFAYLYGSFVKEETFRDIDIGIYIKNPDDNPFFISSDIQTKLSQTSKQRGLSLIADLFDVKVINHAPFTFLKRIFKEGKLIVDNNPDLRTDMIEYVSLKYRECSGLLAEASLV